MFPISLRCEFNSCYRKTRCRMKICLVVISLFGIFIFGKYLLLLTPNPQDCNRLLPSLRPSQKKVTEFSHKFIIPEVGLCSGRTDPFLLIIIESDIKNVEERRAIRNTWGSSSLTRVWANGGQLEEDVRLLFIFGVSTDSVTRGIPAQESHRHGDVVQADFLDSYRNLTVKTTAALKWVSTYCSSVKFILKADDDVFIHIPNWIKALKTIRSDNFFLGHYFCGNMVMREGHWSVNESVYPYEVFPIHDSGPFYAFRGNMARTLLDLAEHLPYIPVEDAFFSGILAQILNAEIVRKDELFCLSLCSCFFERGDKAGAMGVPINNMYDLWNNFKDKPFRTTDFSENWLRLKLFLLHCFCKRQ